MRASGAEEDSSPPRRRRSESKRVEDEMGRDWSEEERSRRRTTVWGKRWEMVKWRGMVKCMVIVRGEKRMVEGGVEMRFWWGFEDEERMMTMLEKVKEMQNEKEIWKAMAKRTMKRKSKRKVKRKAKATRMRKERMATTRDCGW
jgi:hypothetical protein